jgi:hypothetical protein
VLSVGDSITDDTLEEGLENTAGLLVDHGRDTLDTTTTSETSDSGLCDTLDVVSQNLSVTLGTTLAETLTALAAWKMVSDCCEADDECNPSPRWARLWKTAHRQIMMHQINKVLTSSHVDRWDKCLMKIDECGALSRCCK